MLYRIELKIPTTTTCEAEIKLCASVLPEWEILVSLLRSPRAGNEGGVGQPLFFPVPVAPCPNIPIFVFYSKDGDVAGDSAGHNPFAVGQASRGCICHVIVEYSLIARPAIW